MKCTDHGNRYFIWYLSGLVLPANEKIIIVYKRTTFAINKTLMNKAILKYLLITLRGMGMGAADIIPAVSGGTIALITGIYEKLIASIKSLNPALLKIAYKEGIHAAWKKVNGDFLLALFAGIFISIFSLARLISWLLDNHPILVWAFFFGLIAASAIFLWKQIKSNKLISFLFLIAGAIVTFYITLVSPANTPNSMIYVFGAGCIAICAMILPGISGSFILLLLGKYVFILGAVNELKIDVLAVFAAGCAIGLVSFANVISWLFKKYPNQTLALLTGFMLGSLNKLWPWKELVETRITQEGEIIPLLEKNVMPYNFIGDPLLYQAIFIAICGFIVVFLFERLASAKKIDS